MFVSIGRPKSAKFFFQDGQAQVASRAGLQDSWRSPLGAATSAQIPQRRHHCQLAAGSQPADCDHAAGKRLAWITKTSRHFGHNSTLPILHPRPRCIPRFSPSPRSYLRVASWYRFTCLILPCVRARSDRTRFARVLLLCTPDSASRSDTSDKHALHDFFISHPTLTSGWSNHEYLGISQSLFGGWCDCSQSIDVSGSRHLTVTADRLVQSPVYLKLADNVHHRRLATRSSQATRRLA
jgi:hypothetical protein